MSYQLAFWKGSTEVEEQVYLRLIGGQEVEGSDGVDATSVLAARPANDLDSEPPVSPQPE